MKKLFLVAVALVVLGSCSSAPERYFVKVDGVRFTQNGKPYYFAGTNMWYGAWLGRAGAAGDRERLVKELDILAANGITNLRILAASEAWEREKILSPAFQPAPGVVNNDLMIGLDFFLAEMGKRDMKAVVFLNNFWEWSGGMSIYQAWYGGETPIDPNAGGAWGDFSNQSGRFYSNKAGNDAWRLYIKNLIERKNSVTGKLYKDDPTIMSWQLANEPRPGGNDAVGEANVDAWVRWMDETAGFIKSLDPNHLVSTGNEGTMGSLGSAEHFKRGHISPNIDYLTFHMWAKNWGWFKADSMEKTFPATLANAAKYIDDHIKYATELNKPIVMEEFGLGRDFERNEPGTPTSYRDRYFAMVFGKVEEAMKNSTPLAGTNVWAWGGLGRSPQPDFFWRPGDPFIGDPPQEPQGLNSLFASDYTTLAIIKKHAEFLRK
jgi:mannan endo-1,4-beta-mannosidase